MTNLSVRQVSVTAPVATTSPAKKAEALAPQSFMDELSRTVAEVRTKYGIVPSPGNATAGNTSRQRNVAGQDSVAAGSGTSTIGLNALVPTTTTTVPPAAAPAASNTVQSPDDAYWAAQPAAVQQLRNIGDYNQRQDLAAQLASEGYSIDTPVMVWGWDPSKTTQLRQGFGYTWVPSAMQSPVTAAPGISGAGIIPYDPAHPPAGSIKV